MCEEAIVQVNSQIQVIYGILGGLVGGIVVAIVNYFLQRKLDEKAKKDEIRQKAILIAELIAEWDSKPEDKKRLNQLTFEAFIWLPKNLAEMLSKLLSHDKDSPTSRKFIAEVRKEILEKEEVFDENIVIHFPKTNE